VALNIEIKAKARDFSRLKLLAERLSDTTGELLFQEDTFFRSSIGRLKLRVSAADRGELIHYERDDSRRPRQSTYHISKTKDPASLKAVLSSALEIQGVVRKRRLLFTVGQARIHLDEVKGLGQFVELEFVMQPNQNSEHGTAVLRDLMKKLEINDEDLIAEAYVDLLSSSIV